MEKVMTGYFSRFLLVGIINTIVGLSTMYLLLHIGLSYWTSTFIGNVVGAGVSYFLNRSFTFRSDAAFGSTVFRFCLVIGTCYVVAYYIGIRIASTILEHLVNIPFAHIEGVAVLLGTGLYTILNFIGQKKFVFAK